MKHLVVEAGFGIWCFFHISLRQRSRRTHTGKVLENDPLKQAHSCGFLIVTGAPVQSFLLMEHEDRWDLPKGHINPGESDTECALRELEEETGFVEKQLLIDPDFCYQHRYFVSGERYGNGGSADIEKTVRIFLAAVDEPLKPELTEHVGFRWFPWDPPHKIQEWTIDPMLAQLDSHLRITSGMDQ